MTGSSTVEFRSAERFPGWRGLIPWQDRVEEVTRRLHLSYPGLKAVVDAYPVAGFDSGAHSARATAYTELSPQSVSVAGDIPAALRPAYLCALLLWEMTRFGDRFPATGLAPEFALHYADSFNRILDQVATRPNFASLADDAFLKDLWITRVVMIPAAAQVWWPRSGLSLTQLARAGPDMLARCIYDCGGRRPLFEGHTHDSMVEQGLWTRDGWVESLRLVALAMTAAPGTKGAFSTAWYFDPKIAAISPRLGFAAALLSEANGYCFRVGPNERAVAAAIQKSETRRRLYAQGLYQPTNYCAVWPRRQLVSTYGR